MYVKRPTHKIFVFGSNLAGRHGKGAAETALRSYGAKYGQGSGPQGRSWAIATKDRNLRSLPLDIIEQNVKQFLADARNHPELDFYVTRVGCGLAGYTDADIKPFFKDAPDNCELPEGWRHVEGG